MSRLTHAWSAMEPEQRLASISSVALLVTMFFPWYSLQSVSRAGISSHSINAFGDLSFVEAAVFLVAASVVVMMVARVEDRQFHLPGGDGTIVMLAGGWAAVLIFYRVFSRPSGHGYPVGIEWGFFLAFVAAGALTYAGWRMRSVERPEPPASARRRPRRAPPPREPRSPASHSDASSSPPRTDVTELVGASPRAAPGAQTAQTAQTGQPTRETRARSAPVAAEPKAPRTRPRYPPAPPGAPRAPGEAEQLSFEDSPPKGD
ncbi:MAG TPA: hypothetical protein VHY83_01305 [Solirubrobacteraceae bacterium]|jgi:type IV secretory pathway TrbD component|nr:hypothetical protein [Solirubrobacteraceae bacterium]